MIDARHARNIIDVQVRSYRGADCNTENFMVKLKYRPRISTVNRATGQNKFKYNFGKLQNTTTVWEYMCNVTVNEEL
jgi:hypothetical protein